MLNTHTNSYSTNLKENTGKIGIWRNILTGRFKIKTISTARGISPPIASLATEKEPPSEGNLLLDTTAFRAKSPKCVE
jgi:hypothetical protein